MSGRRTRARVAMVLLAVLVVIVLGALMGTIALEQSSITATNARLSLQRRMARAIAWSGVRGVMAELDAARTGLIQGGDVNPTGEWALFEDGLLMGRVRLLPLGGEDGPMIESEAGKINLNTASESMLARLAGLGAERAGAVRGLATDGGVASVEDLRRAGIDPADEAGTLGGVMMERIATAYSIDPDVTAGVGDGGGGGRARATWDPDAGTLDGRASDRAVNEVLERLIAAGVDLSSAEATAAALASNNVERALWGPVWDALAFSTDGMGREGLVDIARASEAVLACVPGLEGHAAELVQTRERTGAERIGSVAWPLETGMVTEQEMAQALPWLTMRTLHWRVRVAGELVRRGVDVGEEQVIASVVLEAVIDVSGERARVAYLRDVSFVDLVPGIDAMLEEERESAGESQEEEAAALATLEPEGEDAAPTGDPGGSSVKEVAEEKPSQAPTATGAGRGHGRQRGRWMTGE